MEFNIGKVYIGYREPLPENQKWARNISTFICHPDDYLHPLYKSVQSQPFLIIDELNDFHNDESKKYRVLIEENIWFFIYYGEPQTKFELIC